jgi:hypothetical protein
VNNKKRIFTPEVLANIPQMVANGLSGDDIAVLIGASASSVKVMCSRHKISLRRPNKQRKQPAPPAPLPSNILLKVKVDAQTLALITMRAELKGITINAVAEQLLQIVARDNLYDAVIDDAA